MRILRYSFDKSTIVGYTGRLFHPSHLRYRTYEDRRIRAKGTCGKIYLYCCNLTNIKLRLAKKFVWLHENTNLFSFFCKLFFYKYIYFSYWICFLRLLNYFHVILVTHTAKYTYLICIFNMISVKLEFLIKFMSATFESPYTWLYRGC